MPPAGLHGFVNPDLDNRPLPATPGMANPPPELFQLVRDTSTYRTTPLPRNTPPQPNHSATLPPNQTSLLPPLNHNTLPGVHHYNLQSPQNVPSEPQEDYITPSAPPCEPRADIQTKQAVNEEMYDVPRGGKTTDQPTGPQDQRESVLPQSDNVINEMAETYDSENNQPDNIYANAASQSETETAEGIGESEELYVNTQPTSPAYVSTGFTV